MAYFIAKLQEFTLFQTFWIKKSHSDTKSPYSVIFINSIMIILLNF
jgi:hypothetical protein